MRYRVTEKMQTYATVTVEADSEEEARAKANAIFNNDEGSEVTYETDYDSSKFDSIEEV